MICSKLNDFEFRYVSLKLQLTDIGRVPMSVDLSFFLRPQIITNRDDQGGHA